MLYHNRYRSRLQGFRKIFNKIKNITLNYCPKSRILRIGNNNNRTKKVKRLCNQN